MATQGLTRIRIAALEELGDEKVFMLITEFGGIRGMMNHLFEPHPDWPNGKVGHWAFQKWLEKGGPERKKGWEECKRMRAEAEIEDASQLLDDATIADVRLKAEQAKQKRWMAGALNPEYSSKPSVNVNNNSLTIIGHGLSDALKAIDSQHEITEQLLPTRPDNDKALPATSEAAQDTDDETTSEC